MNPGVEGVFFQIPLRFLVSLPIAGILLLASEILRKSPSPGSEEEANRNLLSRVTRWAPQVYPCVFTFFVAAYIYFRVSGGYLTFAWSLEGAIVLLLGVVLKSRLLRLSSLFLIGYCVGKVFLVDLRGLSEGFRILSFIILGAVMIGISFLYARFRHRLTEFI